MKVYLIASGNKPLLPPSNLTATTISSTQINLAWTDNSVGETGFEIWRSPNGINYTLHASTGAGVVSYNDLGLAQGSQYYYLVRAFNNVIVSAFSNGANATTTLPAPSSLSATAISASRIDLAWTDNSTGEDGFRIERSTDNVNFVQISSVGAGVTSFQNTGLTASTQYYYRVRAYRGSVNSAYSNTANATTTAVVTQRIIAIDTTKTESGSSASNQFNLVFQSGFGSTNFTVDWGDSTTDTVNSGLLSNVLHTYATAGVYDIKITGSIKHNVGLLASSDKLKYMNVKNWGNVTTPTTTQSNAFAGCSNMVISATDYPIIPTGANMNSFFRGCTSLTNENFSAWSALQIQAYSAMFRDCTNFNGNVSNLVNPQFIGGNISSMFSGCTSFTGIGVDTWNMSNVQSLDSAFSQCSSFNGAVENWNVSNVTSASATFSGCIVFNRNLSSWNVGKCTNFSSMFNNCPQMANNSSITSWNIGGGVVGTSSINMGQFLQSANYVHDLSSYNMQRVFSISSFLNDGKSNFNYGVWDIRQVNQATSFMSAANPSTLSAINLANIYIGWSTKPLRVASTSFGTAKYDASGASARAILTATRAVSVTGAIDANANGTYTWNGTRYQNVNGWNFQYFSDQWNLLNPASTVRATSTGSFPLQNSSNPMSGQGWTGAESGIVLTLVGAGWTITDGGQL